MSMNFLKYRKIAEDGRELIRPDLWEIVWIRKPSGVYFPSDEQFNMRITDFDPGIEGGITGMSAEVRGFTISQKTRVTTSGSASFTIVDREDYSMGYIMETWAQGICNRETLQSGRKLNLTADFTMLQYNTDRQVIKKLHFFNAQPNVNDQAETGFTSTADSHLGNMNFALDYEFYDREIFTAPL